MQKTEHFQLNQWDAADPIRREDFNADNQEIDSAIAEATQAVSEKAQLHFGTYTGDDEAERDIFLGFAPKIVMLWTAHGMQYSSYYNVAYGGIAGQGYPCKLSGSNCIVPTESGFRVFYYPENKTLTNYKPVVYYYIAVE